MLLPTTDNVAVVAVVAVAGANVVIDARLSGFTAVVTVAIIAALLQMLLLLYVL